MSKHHEGSTATVLERPAQNYLNVRIAYPREGEVIQNEFYTFQIGAIPEANRVEISIDHGSWQPCRESLGLWWYDWSDYTKGPHMLIARIWTEDVTALSTPRRFVVE